jgi:hypothetical protein
MQPASW